MNSQNTNEPYASLKDRFEKFQEYLNVIKDAQNLWAGFIGGTIGAIIGAISWAVITILTETEFGIAAIGIGYLSGCGVRIFGKGVDQKFGIMGAVLALTGWIIGKILTIVIFLADINQIPVYKMLINAFSNPNEILEILHNTSQLKDLFFIGILIFCGYYFAFKRITDKDFNSFNKL